MDQQEKEIIDDLFHKIAAVAQRSMDRDRAADDLIRAHMAEQPQAAYYMVQTIVMQEVALYLARERLDGREPLRSRRGYAGLLEILWNRLRSALRFGRWQLTLGRMRRGQPGFLSGATETAIGVAGGVALGEIIGAALAPGAVEMAEAVDFGAEIAGSHHAHGETSGSDEETAAFEVEDI